VGILRSRSGTKILWHQITPADILEDDVIKVDGVLAALKSWIVSTLVGPSEVLNTNVSLPEPPDYGQYRTIRRQRR
jgi:hypothetical protein